MAFGFACDDGWFHIINALSQRLHGQYDHYNSKYQERVGRAGELVFPDLEESGWNYRITQEGIDKLKNQVDEEAQKIPEVVQVKEKFGTLRFYCNGTTDKQQNYIDFAESMSAVTCEVCGKPGKTVGRRWLKTLCKEHRKGYE